jgi:hypothetical protein
MNLSSTILVVDSPANTYRSDRKKGSAPSILLLDHVLQFTRIEVLTRVWLLCQWPFHSGSL